ncbi:2Fe-2S iron-sulfur cluster-binding protein [Streptomyces angustmyceticus]|uniref:2Fe-2S iron-sulfur cluster-binding protein n=1 Tax=Streptomyces angustmyceticus TaxID=285578 RepID=UPI0036F1BAF0
MAARAARVCGTCETRVLDGVPDHRDDILSEDDRQKGDRMYLCVSRARTPRLVLDV